jgi:aminoglycoside phosphotransferase (APT) family kinase protein
VRAKSRAMVDRIVEHHLGGRPLRVGEQGGGLTNEVYAVRHAKGEFVVRIGADAKKLEAFKKEQWAAGRAREAGVPAPEIVEVSDLAAARPYMIARKSEGRGVQCGERMAVLRELGGYAARIHTIRTRGYGGRFESDRRFSDGASWDEFLSEEWKLEKKLRTLAGRGGMGQARVSAVREIVEPAGKGRGPVLNHGDLRLKNVLVNDRGKISAILDWENCMSGLAPEWDLSLALHDLEIDEKQELIAGYGLSGRRVTGMAKLMKAINVVNYAPVVEGLAKSGDAAGLERCRMRLRGALDLFSL